jgi:PTH1 family peptidyl-tRNA hydrolase
MVVGLGNPGEKYAANRHNVGFMALDFLARDGGDTAWSALCHALVQRTTVEGRPVLLAKPQTFMNASGLAVRCLSMQLGLDPREILVIFDDVNLPFGKIRVRRRGSAGGHRGLQSVLEELNSHEVPRVRLGIGESEMPPDLAEFVLADFAPERHAEVEEIIHRGASAVKTILNSGIARAMAIFNA